jgi:methyl-galactoside transport system ATP-binding protein
MALVTEERRATGIFPLLSILDNTMMASLQRYSNKLGVLDRKRGEAAATAGVEALRVKTPSMLTHIQDLSGGNQQKVILARWLVTDPEILILDEPTRGIDVGAKYEIYTIMADLAKSGKAIIMISSELPELLAMSVRVLVLCEGKVTNILDRAEATEERVMTYATMLA